MPAPMNLESVFSVLVSRDVDGFSLPRHSQRPIKFIARWALLQACTLHRPVERALEMSDVK